MAAVLWTEPAVVDVESIRNFIANDFPAFVDRIVDRLEKFPFSGHVVPEYSAESRRQVISGAYRVNYLLRDDVCYIVAVVHASRDFKQAVDPSVWDVP